MLACKVSECLGQGRKNWLIGSYSNSYRKVFLHIFASYQLQDSSRIRGGHIGAAAPKRKSGGPSATLDQLAQLIEPVERIQRGQGVHVEGAQRLDSRVVGGEETDLQGGLLLAARRLIQER